MFTLIILGLVAWFAYRHFANKKREADRQQLERGFPQCRTFAPSHAACRGRICNEFRRTVLYLCYCPYLHGRLDIEQLDPRPSRLPT